MKICSSHLVEAKWVKAGVSKTTHKPYAGFWSCPEMDNGRYCNAEIVDSEDNIEDTTPAEELDPRPNQLAVQAKELAKSEEQKIWEAKDRTSMYQTCLKAASEVVAALVQMGIITSLVKAESDIRVMAQNFYEDMKHHREHDEMLPF